MMGKNHKAIGVATSVAISSYGLATGQPLYLLSLAATPFGAMFPDIDHHNSKLGRQKNELVDKLKMVGGYFLSFSLGYLVTDGYYTGSMFRTIIACVLGLSMFIAVLFIRKATESNEHLKFFVKHRGIMHTLIVPAVLTVCGFSLHAEFVAIVLNCFSLGYISHLVADCTTVEGCPVLYPFSRNNFGLRLCRTNTVKETIVTLIIIGGLLCLAVAFWILL